MVTLVFGPRGIPASLPAHAGLRRQHLQVGQRGRRDRARQVPLASRSRACKSWTEADAAAMQGEELGVHTQGPLRRDRPRATTPSGTCYVQIMSDDEHPELDFDPLDDTKIWPENEFPLRHVGTMVLNRSAEELLRRDRADRVRHRRAGRRAGLLRRQDARRAGRSPTPTRSATASGRTTCSCRSTRRKTRRCATNQRDGADGLLRRRGGREPVASTTSRRSPAG